MCNNKTKKNMENRSKKFFNKQEEQKLMMEEALKVKMKFLADKEKMANMKEAYNKMKKRLKKEK